MNGSTAGPARRGSSVLVSTLVAMGSLAGALATTHPAAATPPAGQPALSSSAATADTRATPGAAPTLTLDRTIRTTPFTGSTVSMRDHEGSAYVRRDNSLWLSDDEGQRLYEVNARTGALKRTVTATRLASVHRFGGFTTAGRARTRDLESVAYDAASDRLYAFSGSDCKPSTAACRWRSLPTAFRFTRVAGRLRPQSFQPLAASTQTRGSAWHAGSRRLYVGDRGAVRAYRYQRNTFGPRIGLPGVNDVLGLGFSADGSGLFLTHGATLVSRMSWRTKALEWTVDLAPVGVRDARSVARVGRRLFVSDGYDHRPAGSRLRYAVFVLGAE